MRREQFLAEARVAATLDYTRALIRHGLLDECHFAAVEQLLVEKHQPAVQGLYLAGFNA